MKRWNEALLVERLLRVKRKSAPKLMVWLPRVMLMSFRKCCVSKKRVRVLAVPSKPFNSSMNRRPTNSEFRTPENSSPMRV